MDPRLRQGADAGIPLFVSDPDAPASKVFADVASQLAKSKRSLVGKSLPLQS
jgi:ATP-binding protein involved in chromosome partitioning